MNLCRRSARASEALARQSYHVLLFAIGDGSIPKLFDGNKYPYTIADFLNSHLLENLLVTFDEVVTVEVIG